MKTVKVILYFMGIPVIFFILLMNPIFSIQKYYESVISFERTSDISQLVCNTDYYSNCYQSWAKNMPDELWMEIQLMKVNEIIVSEKDGEITYWMLIIENNIGYFINIETGRKWQPNSPAAWNNVFGASNYKKVQYSVLRNEFIEPGNSEKETKFFDGKLENYKTKVLILMSGYYTSMIFGIMLCALLAGIIYMIIKKKAIAIGRSNVYLYPVILVFFSILMSFTNSKIIDIQQKLLLIEMEQFFIIISIIYFLTTYKKEELLFEISPEKPTWRSNK